VDDTPRIVAHTDWCARNVRIAEDLVAVYDWDSLSLVTESTAVGQAAATWSVTSEPGGSTFPSAAQIAAFIGAYELASGRWRGDLPSGLRRPMRTLSGRRWSSAT
jgi:aminoglycoside phosphotransferase (APT) family kinase protein